MDVQGITIDGAGTRDRDDAIWAELDTRGWTVTVCIADVASVIYKGSRFDETAHRRVETSYMAGGRNRPMLPRRFSEGSCSITKGEDRPVMAIRMRLDHTLETQFVTIDESNLVSSAQLAYDQIPGILESKDHELYPVISPLGRLSAALMEKRRDAGALVLYDLNSGWVTSEEGYLRRLKDTKETFGHIIVQELMVLANSGLANFCAENEIPVPFRNHTARASAPDRESMMERIIQGVRGPVSDLELARKQFGLVMNKASYSSKIEGHYGLNLPAYLHGTSPIRRYADLIAQRQIMASVAKRKLPYSAEEVEQICEHINSSIEAKSKEVSQAALERANRQAESAIRKDDLAHLSDKDFERVVKVAVRSDDFNPFVAEVFLKRLKEDTAALIDMHFILFNSKDDWQPIRKKIIDHLADNPHKAISIVDIAAHSGTGWSEPKYKIQKGGEGGGVVHSVQVEFKKPGILSRKIKARIKKLAEQRAVVEAIAESIGEDLPKWPEPSAEKKKEKGAAEMPPRGTTNPVGALSEYCQKSGIDMPAYDVQQPESPAHARKFIASCKAIDFSVESKPQSSKKAAKKQAALMIIKLLHAKANQ